MKLTTITFFATSASATTTPSPDYQTLCPSPSTLYNVKSFSLDKPVSIVTCRTPDIPHTFSTILCNGNDCAPSTTRYTNTFCAVLGDGYIADDTDEKYKKDDVVCSKGGVKTQVVCDYEELKVGNVRGRAYSKCVKRSLGEWNDVRN